MYQSFVTGDGQASSYGSPGRGGCNVRFQTTNPFETLATVVEGSSDGSSSVGSSSGGSLSQIGRGNDARSGPVMPSRGWVDVEKLQAAQQLVSFCFF
jgi:hypothetical protein